jgi:anti-sigma regulatory factor (Ser/Thr protein kinase)
MNEWPLHSFLELAALPSAAACARLHAKHLLWEWGLDKLSDDVELIVSELVTNSLHAVEDTERGLLGRSAIVPCIELSLSSDKEQVLIEVWDGNPRMPAAQAVETEGIPSLDEGGRGLTLVEALSERWGCYPMPMELVDPQSASRAIALTELRRPRMTGKVVWAILL